MQLTYGQYFDPAIAGMPADNHDIRVDSFAAESAISPGYGVVDGTMGGKQVKPPAGAVTGFRGVAMRKSNCEQDASGVVQYKAKDSVAVVYGGRIWVPVKGAITWDADVYLIHTGADAGKFIASSGANQGQISGAKFKTTTTGDGIAVIELK